MKMDMLSNVGLDLKTLKLRNAWEQKLATGNVAGKEKPAYIPNAPQETEEDDSRMQQIRAKLQCGGKLTEQERKYLQENDPQTYSELLEEEREQKNYERMLRSCRTKGEVQHLKLGRIASSLDRMKKAEGNGSLSKEEKLEIAGRELRNINHAIRTTQEYLRGNRLSNHAAGDYSTMEEKLRSLLKERIEKVLDERANRVTAYDTFRRSGESEEDDTAKRIKELYAEIQDNWQESAERTGWSARV